MSNEKYIQFPISLLRNVFSDRVGSIDKMLDAGIYNYSKKFRYALEDVARQVIYDLYHKKIGSDLRTLIEGLGKENIGNDPDYRGFELSGKDFGIDEIPELLKAFEFNQELQDLAVEHYQMHQAMSSLGVEGNILMVAKKINLGSGKTPQPSIRLNLIWQFRDKENTEFEIAQFLAYIAIRSILGQKQYLKTNKEHIVARMFGYSSKKDFPAIFSKEIQPFFKKYSKRYHIDKVLKELELNWHIFMYSTNIRGIYIALDHKISLSDLVLVAEARKRKTRLEILKNEKKEARNNALRQLNKENQLS